MKTSDEKPRLFYDGIINKAKMLFLQKTRGEKFEELTIKIANTEEVILLIENKLNNLNLYFCCIVFILNIILIGR